MLLVGHSYGGVVIGDVPGNDRASASAAAAVALMTPRQTFAQDEGPVQTARRTADSLQHRVGEVQLGLSSGNCDLICCNYSHRTVPCQLRLLNILRAELQAHLDLRIDDNLTAGMSPAEARREITRGSESGETWCGDKNYSADWNGLC